MAAPRFEADRLCRKAGIADWRANCSSSRMKPTRFLALAAFALPVLAHAHPGHDGHELTWDFTSGAAHPFTGWDHLLAMVAIGFWAAQLGGRSRWLVPAAFLGVMAVGAVAAQAGLALPGLEAGIAASLLVLGLFIAAAVRLPAAAGMAVAGGFALFHGLAHGAEIPATAGGLGYGAGFIAATALLHAAGLGLGGAFQSRPYVARFAGGAVALAGAAALVL
jgi:urease accessory protein